ncbi:Tc toxin subunit A [Pseudomonas sp. NFR16]|uniref:Tc toxin subunit A-related protein n=1 Tax=Pseudomonas sp. NFR16 TaxID=1566248 RepID=UPI0008C2C963|nr:Tc toxin subunit A [Pseudomonas sp. NFR16]SEJ87980.1 virulence plasmid A protein [Pseudomonas sp. NFR16]
MDDTLTSATYARLFPEQVADKCAPDALESNVGPLAYLHALYRQALSLEAIGDDALQIKLAARRPDIEEQVLNQSSLEDQLPALTLVIDAMERTAASHAGKDKDLAEEIAKAHYPAQLPYHLPLEQIKSVLKQKKTSLFDLLQRSKYSYPNFTADDLRTDGLREVMLKAAGFNPALQSLLLDDRATTSSDYLQTLYGVTGDTSKILDQLINVDVLCRQTGLRPEGILELLATSGVPDDGSEAITTVKRSTAFASAQETAPLAGHIYGAVFINNGTAPALSLEDVFEGPGINLRIKGASAERLRRIHKMIHLQQALQIPFAQVDLLVMAALRAEGQNQDFRFTQNTLRALGVFCYMRDEYNVSPEQFAALINGLTPYAVGEETPFLDRVLDGPGAGQLADAASWLTLDGLEFDISADAQTTDSLTKSPIGIICRAFALEERVANVHLTRIIRALGLKKPSLSLPVFSSLYRLTRLPRLLRLSMDEGTSLIALLAQSNPRAWVQLAGKPEITRDEVYFTESDEVTEAGECDILDVLASLLNLNRWLRQQGISAQALLSWLPLLPDDLSAGQRPLHRLDARIQQTLVDALPRIGASLLTETQIAQEVGSAVSPASGSWLDTLSAFLDARGLMKPTALAADKKLADLLADALKGKLKSANALLRATVDINPVSEALERLITNATVAQEDVVKHILSQALGKDEDGRALTPEHALALLRWVEESRYTLLADVLTAQNNASSTAATLEGLNLELWDKLARHAQVIKYFQLSPAGLTALLDHPDWFELAGDTDSQGQSPSHPPALTLELCYQVGCYREWINKCQNAGFAEDDALDYFAKLPSSDQADAPLQAARRLGKLIGWPESEVAMALPYVEMKGAGSTKTFDDFLGQLTSSEMYWYRYCEEKYTLKGLGALLERYLKGLRANAKDPKVEQIYDKFVQFLKENPGTLKVRKDQYLPTTRPTAWARIAAIKPVQSRSQVTLEIYAPDESIAETESTYVRCVPGTIGDIDFILQQQSLCEKTGLSCRSLSDLSLLDSESSFNDMKSSAQILIGACSDEELAAIQPALREHWRDALAAYLLGYWAVSSPSLKRFISNEDDLSSYFLTDVWVSSAVNTNVVMQATASLQHYLHRLFARLDPAYLTNIIDQDTADFWRQYLSEYGTWKVWRTQLNHPENLIYYANRPHKSSAFQSLEVELNQGKLDPELLQTAITGYLTKFEQTSNLQIISGYLDGIDPKNDTYHFIGKTNASPPEYYWRSVEMALRDDKARLSPLAWSEWEKISVTPTGQIVQSTFKDSDTTHRCDAIRPVMIEGRSYVFWVERGTVGLPSADDKNQTPTKFKKISVQYIYKQSDGFWSPPNELLCLDGTKDGQRLPDAGNPYLKDDTYVPGLIALVDAEGERAEDPWLRVMLYNCDCTNKAGTAEPPKSGVFNKDYFIESRDLLLIDKKEMTEDIAKVFSEKVYNAFSDIRNIQHPDSVNNRLFKPRDTELGVMRYELESYKHDSISSPNFDTTLRAELEQHLKTISLNEVSRHGFASFVEKYPLTSQLPFWVFDTIVNETVLWSSDGKKLTNNDFNKPSSSYKSPELVAPGRFNNPNAPGIFNNPKVPENTLYFPKKKWSATLSAIYLRDNVIRITAHYPQQIIDRSISPLFTFNTKNSDLSPTYNQHEIFIKVDHGAPTPKSSLPFSTYLTTSDNTITGATYSLTTDKGDIVKNWIPQLTFATLKSQTYSVFLENPDYLFEDSFRIKLSYAPDKESVPIPIVLNPAACKKTDLRLYAKRPNETSFRRLTEQSVLADGQAVVSQEFTCTVSGEYMFALCEAGDPMHNVFATFDYRGLDAWNIAIKRNDQQAQYLDLSSVAEQSPTVPSNVIRLNTLFGKQLVARATRSVERALEWEAQCIKEPTIDENIPTPKVDFHGANGGYFRELFLHLPNLVATRLSEQQQFDEAERWYTQYLFDPYRTQEDEQERPPFWNTRPLAEVGTGTSELRKTVDPTTRAFVLSRYNRQAVFLSMVENWQRQGDHFYRQLTPSTLNHAWLCYQKALKLIGPLPERASVSRWVPMPLKSVNHSLFRAPINARVTTARKTLEHRLFNLRHGLTLDGKILPVMDWRTEGADLFGFGQRGIGQLISTYNSDRAQIPGYRFRQLIPMARAAVQQLQDMGRHYMKLMEDEFNTTLSVLLKQQEIRISDFTMRLQQESINSVKAKKNTLLLGRQAAVFRRDYYTNLIDVGRSPMEEAATGLIWSAATTKLLSIPFETAASIVKGLTPTIIGLAFGNNKPESPMAKTAVALQLASASSKLFSEQLLMESGYERRANGWKFELKQAELDIQSIDLQIKETNIELNAATITLDTARAERQNLEQAHVAMTTGFTIIPTYNWLVARQELLYGPAYDAVLSLCLTTEAAWRYEIGDYKRPAFIKTGAWVDSYKGMLAGESLLVNLQEMENAHIQCNERRLCIKKTIDVRRGQSDDQWLEQLKTLSNNPLVFGFTSLDFDNNYPGHYLRQIRHVSVSFVMASEAGTTLENVSAILTQTDSTILTEPTDAGADYLYKPGTKAPDSIKQNLRAQQQIALSSTQADDGLGFDKADWVYELMFHDGRYLPFEGTGAISRWQLSFTDADFLKKLTSDDGKTSLLKNIQIQLVYTARDGGKDFTNTVKTLMKAEK